MENNYAPLDFLNWFEDVLNKKPGMLGSVADISAMFFVVDNIRSIIETGQRLPHKLSWNEFLVERHLIIDLTPVPVRDNWPYEKLVSLRGDYLTWLKSKQST